LPEKSATGSSSEVRQSIKMKNKWWLVVLGLALLMVLLLFLKGLVGGGEDTWIKDSRGVWIKHGMPSQTPDYVLEQQNIISCAQQLYQQKKGENITFNSRCLGACENYAVDIVHVPRTEEDNQIENQCPEFSEGKLTNFIELDKDGNIIRIV